MTEDEARTKWCPMVRIPWEMSDGRHVTHNRDSDGYISANKAYCCIASDCMMWRWKWSPDDIVVRREYLKGRPDSSLGVGCVSGYCGLAGK